MAEEKRLRQRSEPLRKPDDSLGASGETRIGDDTRVICASAELAERGSGLRFELDWKGEIVPAFAIRHNGRAYAYLNRCAHIAMELDWTQGKFFDADGEYLICSTHGALYAPESGACRGGPCRGAKLTGLDVFEAQGKVYLKTKG
jgi:nitrite reductase/ring-hydroxylating ferredoxin subunit